MSSRGRQRQLAVGGVGALFVGLIIAIGGASGSYQVNAVFEDVRGLIKGGEVTAGAETVGSVADVTIGDDGLPVVTMEIDSDFRLRQGAFANIRLASNLGGVNRFIELDPGTGDELGEGATLGPSQTDHPIDLDIAVSDLNPKTRNDIAAVLAGLDAAVKGRGDDLARGLRNSGAALIETAELLRQVNSDQLALTTLVREARSVVGALAQSPADLGAAAANTALLLAQTEHRQSELGRTARALAPGLRGARESLDLLNEGIPRLTDLAVASGPAIAEIGPTARVVGPAVDALRPMLVEAQALVADTPAQLRLLRPVVKAIQPVVARLDPLLEGAGPLSDYLRVYGPEAVNFFVLWGDAMSNFDAAGNVSRLGFHTITAETHTNTIGPSDGPVAGRLAPPYIRTPGTSAGVGEAWDDYWKSFISGGKRAEELVQP